VPKVNGVMKWLGGRQKRQENGGHLGKKLRFNKAKGVLCVSKKGNRKSRERWFVWEKKTGGTEKVEKKKKTPRRRQREVADGVTKAPEGRERR